MQSCAVKTLGGHSISEVQMMMERAAQNKLDVMNGIKTLRERFAGKYIAFDKGKVLVSAESPDKVIEQLKKKKIKDMSIIAIEFIPEERLVWIL